MKRSVVLAGMLVLGCMAVPVRSADSVETPGPPVPRFAYVVADATHPEPGSTSYLPRGLGVMNLDGSNRQLVTEIDGDGHHFGPVLHPGGWHLAFQRMDAHTGLWIADIATGIQTEVDSSGHSASWSPDGRALLYARSAPSGGELVHRSFDVATGGFGPEEVWYVSSRQLGGPAWSPTDNAVTVHEFTGIDSSRLILLRDGASQELPTPFDVDASAPAVWLPDGSGLAVVAATPNGEYPATYVVDLRNPADPVLMSEASFWVRPHPDSAHLLVATRFGSALSVYDLDGKEIDVIPTPRRLGDSFEITPNGRYVVMTAAVPEPHQAEIVRVDLLTEQAEQLTFDETVSPEGTTAIWGGMTPRIGGVDRIETATNLADAKFMRADVVVIASSADYADALVAAPLAGERSAPILLTDPDRLAPEVSDAIRRLGATSAIMVGGPNTLAPGVQADLQDLGLVVDRIYGPDRFATAVAVMEAMSSNSDIFLVQGRDADPTRGWPDALAVSGLAAASSRPILLTDTHVLPPSTKSALERTHGPITVVGGETSVSSQVVGELRASGREVSRVAGDNRYETSRKIASLSADNGMDATHPTLVTGRSWPDALSAGAAVAVEQTVLLLVDGSDPTGGADSIEWLADRQGTFLSVELVGGQWSIRPSVEALIEGSATRIG